MSGHESAAAVLATVAGLAAIAINYASADPAGAPALAGLAGAITVGVAVLLFAGAIPRAKSHSAGGAHAAQTALVTSAVGFLSVASAWTGLPFVLGTGGAMLGNAARHDPAQRQPGLAVFAIALGIVSVALGLVAVVAL